MARVRCPCGQDYEIPEEQLGERLRCRECGEIFTATRAQPEAAGEDQQEAEPPQETPPEPSREAAAEPEQAPAPPSRPRGPRLGDLAVERALVSQEHINLCVKIQQILREQGVADKRIGEILVDKGLLKAEQLEMLLEEQAARMKAEAAAQPRPPQPPQPRPTETPQPKAPSPPQREPQGHGRPRRTAVRAFQVLALVAILAGVVGLVLGLWPRGGPQRVLAEYLESCREDARQPKAGLAVGDPGMTIRDYAIGEVGEPTALDFGPELRLFQGRDEAGLWQDVAETVEMTLDKRQLLRLLLPALSKAPAPHRIKGLTVTLTPIRCKLFVRPAGEPFFRRGTFRITMARLESPTWDSGWRFATWEPVE